MENVGLTSGADRVAGAFRRAREERRGLVLPFFTAGDPDLHSLGTLLDVARDAGVEVAEVGIPYSDPIADGPVIAQSMHEALGRAVTPAAVFAALRARIGAIVESKRHGDPATGSAGAATDSPAVLTMVSMSIVQRMGTTAFLDACHAAGVAGVIVPDIDLVAADELTRQCDGRGLACVFLVAPTTTGERLRRVVELCRGFVYLLARAGVTGESAGLPDIAGQVAAIRAISPSVPIAAGFGIATPEQVQAALAHADGAIVGSAIVRRIGAEVSAGRDPAPAVRDLLQSLVAAGRHCRPANR